MLFFYILSLSFSNSFEIENKLNLGIDRSYQWHSSDFRTIDSTPTCCFNIEEGLSNSLGFYLNYKVKVYKDLNIGLGFGLNNIKGKVNAFKDEAISIDGVDFDGRFEYAIEQESTLLNYSILFDYKLYKDLYFNLNIAFSNLSNMKYYQYEKLVKPDDRGYFTKEDGSKSRLNNEFRGNKSGQNMNYMLGAALFYELPLNEKQTINLVPSIGYSTYFGELIENTKWSFTNLNLGLGLNYYFHKDTTTFTNELNIDKTLLLAPVILNKGKEVLRNELSYSTYEVELDLIEIGLTAKNKKAIYKKEIALDDSLRLYYKFGKFNEIQYLELISEENDIKESTQLPLNKNKIEFPLTDLINKHQDNVSFNLRLKDKQRVYTKNAFSYVDNFYYSQQITLKFKEVGKRNLKLTLVKWNGSLDNDALLETIKGKLNYIKNVNAIYSNSDIGLKYLRFLDNAKISYNPDDLIPKVLKDYIHQSSYIIINEN